MSYKHLHAFIALGIAACLCTSCHSDLDLANLDTGMQTHLKLALPVASIEVGVKSIFGITDTTANISIDTIDGKAMITWKSQNVDNRTFSTFNLNQKLASQPFSINIHDKLTGTTYETPWGNFPLMSSSGTGQDTIMLPYPYTFNDTLIFTMPIALSDMNRPGLKERLDKALINSGNFNMVVDKANFDALKWDWIDDVVLDLSKNFQVHNGSALIHLYSKGDPGKDFGSKFEINLDTTTLNVMIDETQTPSMYNVYDTIWVEARVAIHVPTGTIAIVKTNSKINCAFNVDKINVAAVWGWFTPYKDMQDEGTYEFGDGFKDMPLFKEALLPFSRPQIEVGIETQVAGRVHMEGEYMRSWDKDDNMHMALFNGSPTFDTIFPLDQCADPHGPLDAVTHLSLLFNNEPAHGQIDELFRGGIPKKISYKFNFSFDAASTPQVRIPVDTYVRMKTKVTMPLAFHQGASIKHTDELQNLDVSQFNVDSIFGSAVKLSDTSKIGIVMKTESSVPLHIKAVLRCYDAGGKIIQDPTTGKEFGLFDTDTLDLYPPTFTKVGNEWQATPVEKLNTATLSKKQLDLFPQIKSIKYTLIVDDKALDEAYKAGLDDVYISPSQGITLTIGLTADVDGTVKLNGNNGTNAQ